MKSPQLGAIKWGRPVKAVLICIILIFFAVFPFMEGSSYMVSLLTLIMIYMTLAHMWNLMGGYAGLLSLGMQAFIGIGGYTLAVLSTKYSVNIYIAILLGGIFSMLFGLMVSPALFKMTGVYFSIGSWVVAEALLIAFSNWEFINYAKGITIKSMYKISGTQIYYTAVILGVIATLMVFLLMRSKIGLALMAMRDNPGAAEATGVRIFSTKLKCYMISCFMTGVAGGVMYMSQAYITPQSSISIQWTVAMTFMVIIGGIGTIEGPIIGAVIYVLLTQFLYNFPESAMIILGALAVAVIIVVPNGIMGTLHNKTGFEILSPRRSLPPNIKELLLMK